MASASRTAIEVRSGNTSSEADGDSEIFRISSTVMSPPQMTRPSHSRLKFSVISRLFLPYVMIEIRCFSISNSGSSSSSSISSQSFSLSAVRLAETRTRQEFPAIRPIASVYANSSGTFDGATWNVRPSPSRIMSLSYRFL